MVWVCMYEDNVIEIAGSIMSMYTDSVMVLLVITQCFVPVKDTHVIVKTFSQNAVN